MSWGLTGLYLTVIFAWTFGRPRGLLSIPCLRGPSSELHPFMPYVFLANLAFVTWGAPIGGKAIGYTIAALQLATWLMDRGDDDDRWKRRRRRMRNKLRSMAGRPALASAGNR